MTSLAIAGSGYVTALHALAARALGWNIVALADHGTGHGTEPGVERARQIGVDLVDPADLPCGADVVVVATDHAYRVEDTLRSLEAGAIVIVESPAAVTLDAVDRLAAAAAAHPGRLHFAANVLFSPLMREAVRRVRAIGELTHLEIRVIQARPKWDGEADAARSALFELGTQPISLALATVGSNAAGSNAAGSNAAGSNSAGSNSAGSTSIGSAPALTSATARLDRDPRRGEDTHASVNLEFDSGIHARVEVGWDAATPTWDLQAASERGVVRAELLPEPLLEIDGDPVGFPSTHSEPPQLGHLGFIDQLASCLPAGNATPNPMVAMNQGPDAALTALEVVIAATAEHPRFSRDDAVPCLRSDGPWAETKDGTGENSAPTTRRIRRGTPGADE